MSNHTFNYVTSSNEPSEGNSAPLTVSKDNKLYHVFRFMQRAYGNDIGRFLTSFNSVLALGALADRVHNKKLKVALNTLKYGVPAFLHGADLYNNIKNYIKEVREEQSPTYNKRISKLCKLLDIKEDTAAGGNLYERGITLEYDLVSWLTMRPNTKRIKVHGLYNADTSEEIDSISTINQVKTPIIIKIEYKGIKYLIEATIVSPGEFSYIDNTSLVGVVLSDTEAIEILRVLTCEFIESLNIKKNTLFFSPSANIKCTPRIKVDENINQFDVPSFIKEIRQVLDCGRKRAYVFVSRPGTGKSTILRKIEEEMTDTVIFHMSPEDMNHAVKIAERFAIAGNIPKCIVIIEDLDACGLQEKNDQTGVFLNAIDDVNNKLNMVILVTVNDTSRVHFSVLNRPGRFDRVIEIMPPQSKKEVYAIMLSKSKKLKKSYCPDSPFNVPPYSWNDIENIGSQVHEPILINQSLLQECLDQDYTQAEIANAVTEQIFLDASIAVKDKKCTWAEAYDNFNIFFKDAIKSHEDTRTALRSCDFKNQDPAGKDLEKSLEEEEETMKTQADIAVPPYLVERVRG